MSAKDVKFDTDEGGFVDYDLAHAGPVLGFTFHF